jgi:hypothetical protein
MVAFLIKPITSARNASAKSDAVDYVAEAAAQSFQPGSPIVNAAGVYSEGAANPTVVEGFAREAGSNLAANDTFANLPWLKASDGKRFSGCLVEAIANNLRGALAGLVKDGATGIWMISTAVVNKPVRILDWDSRVAVGDTNAPVEFELVDLATG